MADETVGAIGKERAENMDTNRTMDRGGDKICKTKIGKAKRAKREENALKVRRGKKERPKEKEKEKGRNAGDVAMWAT